VHAFLKGIGMLHYAKFFEDNGFDNLESIAYLTDEMLIQMGVDLLGHRALILRAAKQL
jgi:hypothetical protein